MHVTYAFAGTLNGGCGDLFLSRRGVIFEHNFDDIAAVGDRKKRYRVKPNGLALRLQSRVTG